MIALAWTFLSGGISRLFGTLAKLPWQVWAILGSGIMAWLLWSAHVHEVTKWRKQAERAVTALEAERKAHAVTLASVETLKAALAQKNAETEARAKAYAQTKRDYTDMLKAADARQKATARRVNALLALARQAEAKGACRVPAGLLGDMEGL